MAVIHRVGGLGVDLLVQLDEFAALLLCGRVVHEGADEEIGLHLDAVLIDLLSLGLRAVDHLQELGIIDALVVFVQDPLDIGGGIVGGEAAAAGGQGNQQGQGQGQGDDAFPQLVHTDSSLSSG